MTQPQQITVLGATGSIGVSTLKVLALHPEQYQVFALTANTNAEKLLQACIQTNARVAVLADASRESEVRAQFKQAGCQSQLLFGSSALLEVASASEVDVVMAAIVGSVGLLPTLAAARAGKKILLANKEALVMSGPLLLDEIKRSKASLLPIDSEHNAIFQCLPWAVQNNNVDVSSRSSGVEKIILTGSGGPFLHTPLADLALVTPAQACKHPNWSMGRKISVDSATMMNKGLELIEACLLFGVSEQAIDIVIHPQSIVHSMVRYDDGSVLAQLGNPDMCTPIAHALAWPQRIAAGVAPLDLTQLTDLSFQPEDTERFPCLALARSAVADSAAAVIFLNAANEVAVSAFLAQRLKFDAIPQVVDATMHKNTYGQVADMDTVLAIDAEARVLAQELVLAKQ